MQFQIVGKERILKRMKGKAEKSPENSQCTFPSQKSSEVKKAK
jgi:hypothetical protein